MANRCHAVSGPRPAALMKVCRPKVSSTRMPRTSHSVFTGTRVHLAVCEHGFVCVDDDVVGVDTHVQFRALDASG